jgi:uncharacterized protein (TIGR02145 family)
MVFSGENVKYKTTITHNFSHVYDEALTTQSNLKTPLNSHFQIISGCWKLYTISLITAFLLSCSLIDNKEPDSADQNVSESSFEQQSSYVGVSSVSSVLFQSSSIIVIFQSSSSGTSSTPISSSSTPIVPILRTCIYAANPGSIPVTGTLKCPNNENYTTVTIGSAVWMAQNLNYGLRVNGNGSTANQSNDYVVEKYCYYDLDANCITDGGLYQWAEAMGFKSDCNSVLRSNASCNATITTPYHQGICPIGWHIPGDADWTDLIAELGGDIATAGAKMRSTTTTFASWNGSSINTNDGNTSGFSAVPAGNRGSGGFFGDRGFGASFRDASEYNASNASYHYLPINKADLESYGGNKTQGLSVRCVKNNM